MRDPSFQFAETRAAHRPSLFGDTFPKRILIAPRKRVWRTRPGRVCGTTKVTLSRIYSFQMLWHLRYYTTPPVVEPATHCAFSFNSKKRNSLAFALVVLAPSARSHFNIQTAVRAWAAQPQRKWNQAHQSLANISPRSTQHAIQYMTSNFWNAIHCHFLRWFTFIVE